MNCPICNSATSVEVSTHSSGYAKGVMECANCEAVWLCGENDVTIVKTKKAA